VSVSCPEMFKRALLTLLFTDTVESTKLEAGSSAESRKDGAASKPGR
jgi:hypothetical protein